MAIGDLPIPQKNTVLEQQRSQDSLPSYFSAYLRTNVPITREFEAFLILAPDKLKSTAIQWIQQAVSLNQKDQQRDALLSIATANELSNAGLKIAECNKQLSSYNTFRKEFVVQAALSDDPDVQLFLGDLQGVIGNLIVQYDRAFFDQSVATVLQNSLTPGTVTDQQVQELQSWTSVISAYLG